MPTVSFVLLVVVVVVALYLWLRSRAGGPTNAGVHRAPRKGDERAAVGAAVGAAAVGAAAVGTASRDEAPEQPAQDEPAAQAPEAAVAEPGAAPVVEPVADPGVADGAEAGGDDWDEAVAATSSGGDDWDEAVAEVGEATARLWGLYMAACRLGFERNVVQLHQVLCVKLGEKGSADVPLRPWWTG